MSLKAVAGLALLLDPFASVFVVFHFTFEMPLT